jgi:DNA-directed RNA polymerase subunit M/transcription elongation factor TFIIS
MLADCPKCGPSQEIKMEKETEIVRCVECKEEVNVSSFFKNMMKSKNEFFDPRAKLKIPEGGMMTKCLNCQNDFSAEIEKDTKKVFCPHCKQEARLSDIVKERLLENKIFPGTTKALMEEK